jgi:hypothetical protein
MNKILSITIKQTSCIINKTSRITKEIAEKAQKTTKYKSITCTNKWKTAKKKQGTNAKSSFILLPY